ncbi:MAG: chromate transporter [Candidatus Riflebacteria bacterium]|nr:chromate transporter [Candidatus Riflebacteria bacterium]
MSLYWALFKAFFIIGLFGFGGGYAMLPMINQKVTQAPNFWLTAEEFSDIVAISELTPGPVSINTATFVGFRVTNSVWGSLLATVAVCLPSFIIMLTLTKLYMKYRSGKNADKIFAGLKPVILGLIATAGISLISKETFIDWKSYVIFILAFAGIIKKLDPIKMLLAIGLAGLLIY